MLFFTAILWFAELHQRSLNYPPRGLLLLVYWPMKVSMNSSVNAEKRERGNNEEVRKKGSLERRYDSTKPLYL